MEQQHSARTGRKDPGQGQGKSQGQGQEEGQSQKQARRARRSGGRKPSAAAAATPASAEAEPADSPVGRAHAPTGASQESRRRGSTGAVRQEAAALYHAQLRFPLIPPLVTDAFAWLPRARLTALGSGLLGLLLMVLTGAADKWLRDGSPTAYGGAFLLVCVVCAAWVRPTDLGAAPIAMPIAFTAGLAFISGGTGTAGTEGLTERLTNLFTALAVSALWLYAGTLIAVVIVTTRKIALMVQKSRVRALMEAVDAQEEAAETDPL